MEVFCFAEMGDKFISYIEALAEDLFDPEKIVPKLNQGSPMKCSEFGQFFSHFNITEGDRHVEVKSLYEVVREKIFIQVKSSYEVFHRMTDILMLK